MSTIRAQTNSSSVEEMNRSTAQNSQKSNAAHAELQNAMLQLAKTQSKVLNSLAQNQMQLQENNTVMMTDLLSSHHNLYVLDVGVYDGKTARLEDWLLQVEKASELTKIKPYKIAFAKSHGSPHKIIKKHGSWQIMECC